MAAPLFALLCDCYFLPLKVSFAEPAENPGQLLFCACVYSDCQVSCYGRSSAEMSGICHRSCNFCARYGDFAVKGMGTLGFTKHFQRKQETGKFGEGVLYN